MDEPPSASFWRDALFFDRFDEVLSDPHAHLQGGSHSRGVSSLLQASKGSGDWTENRFRHLALVAAFTEMKHTEAIDAVALSVFGRDGTADLRGPNGLLRRFEALVRLYATDQEHLIMVEAVHRHVGRRRVRYRLTPDRRFSAFDPEALDRAARSVRTRMEPDAWPGKDEVRTLVGAGLADAYIAMRHWPRRKTGRAGDGIVRPVDLPDWIVMHLSQGGARLDVSDDLSDQAARYAAAVLAELAEGRFAYEPVMEPLTTAALSAFLDKVTDPSNGAFPLIELHAEAPWQPHRTVKLAGTPTNRAEGLVADLRAIHHPFARDPATVRHVKILFEGRYRIQVNFPRHGEPIVLTFADADRSGAVTARFIEMMQQHLRVEVAPKAPRGAQPPAPAKVDAPRVRSREWWAQVFKRRHDRPAEWLEMALARAESEGWIRRRSCFAFACNSSYIDRRRQRVDSLDCPGDVEYEMPGDPDDRTREEDQNEVRCSEGSHVWRPQRWGLPAHARVYVDLDHDHIQAHLMAELSHYGEVRRVPNRPGLLRLTLDDAECMLVYVPAARPADRERSSFPAVDPVAWVVEQLDGMEREVLLPDVLAGIVTLFQVWGVHAPRRGPGQTPALLVHEGVAEPSRHVIIRAEGVFLGTTRVAGPTSKAITAVVRALGMAAADFEARGVEHAPVPWMKLNERLAQHERASSASQWQTWVSRARKAFDDASGVPGFGKRLIVTRGAGMVLGDDVSVRDASP
jgi:hypothetical protein